MKRNHHMPEAGHCSRISLKMIILVVFSIFCFGSIFSPGASEANITAADSWPANPQINNVTSSPATYDFTPSAGSNRIVLISIHDHTNNTTATTITVTYGSNNIPARAIINSPNNQRRQVWLFYLNEEDIAAATGSTITVTNNNVGNGMSAYIATFAGVDQNITSTVIGSYSIYNPTVSYSFDVPIGGYAIFASTDNTATDPTNNENYTGNASVAVGSAYSYIADKVFDTAATTSPTYTTDATYSGFASAAFNTSVTLSTPGITVNPTSGLTTTEAGGQATFTIVLDSAPTNDVTIGLSSSDTTEGNVSPASVTFAGANWSTPQTVTVTGVDDAVIDGNIAYTIVTAPASSADSNYNNMNAADVSVTNMDNDGAPAVPVGNWPLFIIVVVGMIVYGLIWRRKEGKMTS